ncbi:hypothetical protein RRG08_062590 [Elysia crispata]|uniref:Uncharacterized protein n=1 Tax=Elysia crispata TaxID=231223 RepID=A0AAE0YY70_9GAST|nr:hypothetical protein RRG08_062590 [Elysia crispata]
MPAVAADRTTDMIDPEVEELEDDITWPTVNDGIRGKCRTVFTQLFMVTASQLKQAVRNISQHAARGRGYGGGHVVSTQHQALTLSAKKKCVFVATQAFKVSQELTQERTQVAQASLIFLFKDKIN